MEQRAKPHGTLSSKGRVAFGATGRPREDRQARQREIYEAVGPLVMRCGARRLTMRAAAAAAYLSVGGLYHYFSSKRELVLHGLQPETLARYCADALPAFAHLAETEPEDYLLAYCHHMLRLIDFIRPAFAAALELGAETVHATLEASLASGIAQFAAALRAAAPALPDEELAVLSRRVRRLCLGALLERQAEASELQADLLQLVGDSARASRAR